MGAFLMSISDKWNTPIAMVDLETKGFELQITVQINMIHITGGYLLEQILIPVNDEKGQSAIEFILTFAFGLGIVFLFAIQSLNATKGFLVHYANFMAARTYQVNDLGIDNTQTMMTNAAAEAAKVFSSYALGSFGINAQFKIITPNQGRGIYSGGVAEFSEALSALPFVGGGATANFYSESFLGKEPLRMTCFEQTCAAITGSPNGCEGRSDQMDVVIYDNGC